MVEALKDALLSPYGAVLSGLLVLGVQLACQAVLEARRKPDPESESGAARIEQSDSNITHQNTVINSGGWVHLNYSRHVNLINAIGAM